uniref:Sc:d156 n=1 Tax=Astyanax mexicanus TaxID=7994 RepID=A0A8B9GST2_ASTMX
MTFFFSVQSDSSGWGVNYPGSICAVRGSNVRILCSYFYPSLHEVETVLWCSMNSNKLKCDDKPPYVYDSSSNSTSEEFKYTGNKLSNCTLLISNVQFSHSAEYKFRFITNVTGGRWTGGPGVTLQFMTTGATAEGDSVNLTCAVNCSLSSPQFVWFKNNQRLPSSDPVLHSSALTVEDSGNYSLWCMHLLWTSTSLYLTKPCFNSLPYSTLFFLALTHSTSFYFTLITQLISFNLTLPHSISI